MIMSLAVRLACGTDFALLPETPTVETASASPKPIESFLKATQSQFHKLSAQPKT